MVMIVVIIAFVIAFNIFEFDRFFSLAYLKASKDAFAELYARYQWQVIGLYMLIYILATALSVPGAAALTMGGGALFGLIPGTIIVSFASTIGATLACFVSRFILRDWVQQRFGDKLTLVNKGIQEEGKFYLFTLRLIPVFPFFVINLVMGLTKMPLLTFYWVSQVGMLAGTVVYVNAGRELARIESLSGIMSPRLMISFAVLGMFPITVKKLSGWYRMRRKS